MSRYQLELTEEHLQTIVEATELLARINIGQLGDVADCIHIKIEGGVSKLKDSLRNLEPLVTRMAPNAHLGISHERTPRVAKLAWEIYQSARYRLSWDKYPEGGFTVNFDKPDCISGIPLPVVRQLAAVE